MTELKDHTKRVSGSTNKREVVADVEYVWTIKDLLTFQKGEVIKSLAFQPATSLHNWHMTLAYDNEVKYTGTSLQITLYWNTSNPGKKDEMCYSKISYQSRKSGDDDTGAKRSCTSSSNYFDDCHSHNNGQKLQIMNGIKNCFSIEHSILQKCVTHDEYLEITCQVVVYGKRLETEKKISASSFEADAILKSLHDDMEFRDFAILAEGKEVRVHKCVLAAHSKVFEKMLKSNMRESRDGIMNIADLSFKGVKQLVQYLYTGQVKEMTGVEYELIKAADKYDLKGLFKLCESVLIKHLNEENAWQYLVLAQRHSALALKDAAKRLV